MTQLTSNGVTTTAIKGSEKYEFFTYKGQKMTQYDYRHTDGKLFSCVCETLEDCRIKRDKWVSDKE